MKKLSYYIIPVMVHMAIVCVIAALMGISGIRTGYDSAAGMVLIAVGGISSALWGALWQIRHKSRRVKDIVLDFFHIKADIKAYLLVLLFLVLDFVPVWFGGAVLAKWYVMLLVFFRSLVFGGIEEIGWRYTFQPELEKGMPYIAATLLTFICWGIWHFMFFYIDGSIALIEPVPFLTGLLINCFILSAVYSFGKNLWLCAMTHALINTFSQTLAEGSTVIPGLAAKAAIVVIAVIVSGRMKRRDADVPA